MAAAHYLDDTATIPAIDVRPRPSLVPEEMTNSTQQRQGNKVRRVRGGKQGGTKPTSVYECSVCQRQFSRREHMLRHERAHRNERPFACDYCDAQFGRRDLIKRHNLRYHPKAVQEFTEYPPLEQTASAKDQVTLSAPFSQPPESGVNYDKPGTDGARASPPPLDSASPASASVAASGNPITPNGQPSQGYPSPNMLLDMDTFMAGIDFSDIQAFQTESLLDPGFTFGVMETPGLTISHCLPSPHTQTVAAPLQTMQTISHQSLWHNSLKLSQAKHDQIAEEMKKTDSVTRVDTSEKIPSRLAFQRHLTNFFQSYLPYLPFIHVPTWRADASEPALLLAMAALGANVQHEQDVASRLHRLARLSILNILERSTFTSRDRPCWVIQALMLVMCFGTASGTFDKVHESLSCQSILAHMVRYSANPQGSWGQSTDDSALSWEAWVEIETANRTKMSVFVYFGNLSQIFGVSPMLLNSEIKINLPCGEAEWTATTPIAWSNLRHAQPNFSATFSDVLRSLLSPSLSTMLPCSTFGQYIMLHALLQQTWYVRQDSVLHGTPPRLDFIKSALQKWQTGWEINPECTPSPQNPHIKLVHVSHVLLKNSQLRLEVEMRGLRSAMLSHDVEVISQSLFESLEPNISCADSTDTAHIAIDFIRDQVVLGMTSSQNPSLNLSGLQYHYTAFECCLFLSQWLRSLELVPRVDWKPHQQEAEAAIRETFAEIDIGVEHTNRPLSAQCIYACLALLKRSRVWGIISIVMVSLESYGRNL